MDMKMIQPKRKPERSKNWYLRRMLPKRGIIWLIVVALSALLIPSFDLSRRPEFVLALVIAVLAGIFKFFSAYHAKVSNFLECFSRCNKAYANLNGRLKQPASQDLDSKHQAADPDPDDAIIDYFNLCAEEHLMHKMGVIPNFVWDVWQTGIHDKAIDKHILNAWDKEKKAACDYYGFDLERAIWEHHKAHGRECENRDKCPLSQVIARSSLAAPR